MLSPLIRFYLCAGPCRTASANSASVSRETRNKIWTLRGLLRSQLRSWQQKIFHLRFTGSVIRRCAKSPGHENIVGMRSSQSPTNNCFKCLDGHIRNDGKYTFLSVQHRRRLAQPEFEDPTRVPGRHIPREPQQSVSTTRLSPLSAPISCHLLAVMCVYIPPA